MEFVLGILVGAVAVILIAVIGIWLALRYSTHQPLPDVRPIEGEPAVSVLMVESFMNAQLREAMSAEAFEIQQETVVATQAKVPLKLKLTDAVFDVIPGRKARFIAQLKASAWVINVSVRPVSELIFVPQDGSVKIIVSNVQIAGFNIPRAWIDRFVSDVVESAQARLNHSLTLLQRDTGVQLSDIETTDELMILKFSRLERIMPPPSPPPTNGAETVVLQGEVL